MRKQHTWNWVNNWWANTWDWINNRWAKQPKRAAPLVPAAELTPHVVFFSTPDAFNHEKLKIDAYKGLLHVEILGGGAGSEGRLLTAWRDKPAYEAAKPRSVSDTGLATTNLLWEGFYLETRQ